ncbi:MAG: ribosomal protein S18-alanine N-acetyltransferase [Oscillospiraceae bacterium]|nr:ribosomal protein S18-alanine N-acetyltransferase [Oscillospiraceae bacterium]
MKLMNYLNPEAHIADGYVYARARAEHIGQIHEIECLSFSEPWTLESFKKELTDGLARYFVAKKLAADGAETEFIVGYCGYWSIAGEAHITNVAVHPGYRGRGVGAGLIHAMLCDIRVLGHSAATLEVREDNHTAIRLYGRFGFTAAGKRKNYYDRGTKDALVMWARLD